jgi:E3 ubiquitin-protein ligase UBR4
MSCLMCAAFLCVQGGSAGSESGGSGVDSITGEHNVSGRSSAYGDNMQEPLVGARSDTSSLGAPAGFQVCIGIKR